MSEIETIKKEFIENIYNDYRIHYGFSPLYKLCNVDSYKSYFKFMNSKTFDEIIDFTTNVLCKECESYQCGTVLRNSLIDKVKKAQKELQFNKITNEITAIKDSMQNTADVVNLFIDIDKNRSNLEDRIDKLEQKIEQIINMMQKS